MACYRFDHSIYPQLLYVAKQLQRYKDDDSVWGALAWEYIDRSIAEYPVAAPTQSQIDYAKIWLHCLFRILPCFCCRTHYQQFVASYDLDLATSSRAEMQTFFDLLQQQIKELQNTSVPNFDREYADTC